MSDARVLLELVVVLGTAAVVTIVFQALRLPVVLGYVLAGLMIGPHVPVPLVADPTLIHVLSELGVILLMFTIGLELPLKTIARVGVGGALTALFEVGLVIAVGTLVARLIGFDSTTAVFVGMCLGISSTMLVAKAFEELGWKGGFTEVVFAILVFEDLIAIVLLAVATAVASGAGLDLAALGILLAKLGGFLVASLIAGLLVVPRIFRWVATKAKRETLLISALVVCFGAAVLAHEAGYSVALGAFLAGVMIAESGHGHAVFALVESFRDVFAMVFFVSVGLSIDPALLGQNWLEIIVFALVVLIVKPIGVAVGVFASGQGVQPAVRAGVSLAQVGEFSFVIAGVIGSPQLLAIAVGVSCITAFTSPISIRRSEDMAAWTAHRMPSRLATFVSFYERWLARPKEQSTWRRHRRSVIVLAVDAAVVIAAVIVGAQLDRGWWVQLAVTAIAGIPFAISMIRRIALLSHRLANEMVPVGGATDLGHAPRRALVLTLELALSLAIVVPLVAVIQPFVQGSFAIFVVVALVLVLAMRRSIADFEGHVRASSEVILEMLASGTDVAAVATILPGFAGTATIHVPPSAAGKTLAALDLRAKTGATVLAISRGAAGIATPSPTEPLQEGDILALAGSDDAIAAARHLLGEPGSPS